jgi:hypothetical protein
MYLLNNASTLVETRRESDMTTPALWKITEEAISLFSKCFSITLLVTVAEA